MPAERLPFQHKPDTPAAPVYAVVGTYPSTGHDGFVLHIALLAEETKLSYGQSAAVWHMRPPLESGEHPVHVVGTTPLTLDDVESLHDWRNEVDKEPPPDNPFRRYIVRPHSRSYHAPETNRKLYQRFSCVGYVIECYRSIDVDLVVTSEPDLPEVDSDTLEKVYPDLNRIGARMREVLGIPGNGPWPILMPGYVFHALAQATEETPRPPAYTPESTEYARFPYAAK
ncbi:MAG: hypothetical protein NTW96_00820 [Planctomycetia bacterium]|nr:hypothetical protein [Planctomycetia bacterium]